MTKNKTIYLKTSTKEMTLSKLRKVATLTLMYAVQKKGTNKHKSVPKVSIIHNPKDRSFGVYKCDKNTIVVNTVHASSLKLFIQTLLHEYTHYLQNMTTYSQLYKKVGYDKHPYELESRESEKLYSEAFKYIKELI